MPPNGSSEEEFYQLGREYRESARLYLQQWLWQSSLGYNLHPVISDSASTLRVADVGTGNGCWLLALAREVPTSWAFEGFDISEAQYPSPEYLPSNVTLKTLDAFDTLPEDLKNIFDVVHIRAFTVVIKGGTLNKLLESIVAMLKPGGYIQWDEVDAGTFYAEAPRPSISTTKTEEYLREWQESCAKANMKFDWINSLPNSISSCGLKVIQEFRLTHRNDLKKAFTANWLTALEEAGKNFAARGGDLGPFQSIETFRESFDGVLREVKNGAEIGLDLLVVVAQKGS